MYAKYKNSFGFTLIELLVVIALIAIITSFSVANFSSGRQRGRDTQRKSDLLKMVTDIENYKSINGYYPKNRGTLNSSYPIPSDPSGGSWVYAYKATPVTAPPCNNGSAGICTGFYIYACLENRSDPLTDAKRGLPERCSGGRYSYTVNSSY